MNEVRKWPDAPNRIYLNVCDECSCDAKFMEHCEVTWCKDRQFESDIEYVRADAQPAVAVNKDLAKAIHYPQCWDVAAYPTLAHAISELATCFQCCECVKNPAVAVNEQALRGWNSRHVNETPKIEHDSDDVLMKTGDVNHVGDANKMVRLTDKQIMGIDARTPGGLIQFANAIMDAMIKKNGE